MKKFNTVVLLVLLFALILSGCSAATTSTDVKSNITQAGIADKFLKDNSDKNLLKMGQDFYFIRYDGSDFKKGSILSSQDISQTGMYIFFTITNKTEGYLNLRDKCYHFPISDIQNYIDTYFDGYIFKPSEVKYPGYNEKTGEFVATALPSPNTGFPNLISKKAINKDMVELKINYYDRFNDPKSMDIVNSFTITLRAEKKGYKFVSSIAN